MDNRSKTQLLWPSLILLKNQNNYHKQVKQSTGTPCAFSSSRLPHGDPSAPLQGVLTKAVSHSTDPIVDLAPRSSDSCRSLHLNLIPGFSICLGTALLLFTQFRHWPPVDYMSLQSCIELDHLFTHEHSILSSPQRHFLISFSISPAWSPPHPQHLLYM